MSENNYTVRGVNMAALRNRNESKVIHCMRAEIALRSDTMIRQKDLLDIFALALNKLPARYTQIGTIVLRDPVNKDMVRNAVREAFEKVLANRRVGSAVLREVRTRMIIKHRVYRERNPLWSRNRLFRRSVPRYIFWS